MSLAWVLALVLLPPVRVVTMPNVPRSESRYKFGMTSGVTSSNPTCGMPKTMTFDAPPAGGTLEGIAALPVT